MHKMDPTTMEQFMVYSVVGIAILALVYAGWLARQILGRSKGSEEMQVVWRDIKAGANAYLRTQLRTISIVIAFLTVALFLSVYVVEPTKEADELFEDNARIVIAFARAGAFLMGAGFSAMVGFIGMNMAVEGNVRVAEAANSDPDEKKSYNEALKVAYRSGTITGMLTDGLGLLGGTSLFIIFGKASPDVLLGFGFGGTLLAMFMRVGGGIYTKAADVGADLVGKVEAGMEEDDPRNAAVIADLVGDNVGDCAGMAADIFESYEVTIVSSLILGLALAELTGELHFIILPLLIRGVGVISSIVGTYAVSMWKDAEDAEDAMYKSYELSSAITIFTSLFLAWQYAEDLRVGVLVAIGVALAVAFNPLTAYATSANSKRVQKIAAGTRFGPALVILEGVSLGYLSSVWAVVVIVGALAASILMYSAELSSELGQFALFASLVLAAGAFFYFYNQKKLMNGLFAGMWIFVAGMFLYSMEEVPAIDNFSYVLFGVSLIGVGMLSHTGNNVSMDTFGPISDNANGIGEVAGMEGQARQIMADLDAAGNTTKAITKGVAIGSAVIAALSLYGAFFTDIQRVQTKEPSDEFVAVMDELEEYYDANNDQFVAALNLAWVEDDNEERDDRLEEVMSDDTDVQETAIAAVQEEEKFSAEYSEIREHVEEEVWPRGRETYVDFKAAWFMLAPPDRNQRVDFDATIADLDEVWNDERSIFEKIINLSDATVFTGLLLGAMLPLLFGGLLIKAVNRSAAQIMAEVRRQLRIPEIWEGTKRPEYTQAVEISTRSAQAELIPLGVIAVLSPIVVGILLKEEALGGFLAGVIASGVLQAVFMANSGGAWDNAKKYVEDGHFGGKGSENHKASVVGDTVGDPFKDTAGPALNPMIKVINLVGLIVAPIVVENEGYPALAVIGALVCLGAILWAVQRSDREDDLLAEDEGGTAALTEAEVADS